MKILNNKLILTLWVVAIILIYYFHLNYHFKGNIQSLNNKNEILNDILQNHNTIKSNYEENEKWKIILFAHPECPCTLASIRELKNLAVKYNFEPLVVFSELKNIENSLKVIGNELNDNKTIVKKLKITSIIDENNEIIKKHNFQTSGFTLLFDNYYNLIYTGGVTPYRGHIGESDLHKYLKKINIENYKKSDFTLFAELKKISKLNFKKKNIRILNSVVFGCSLL